jgi:hypothetical protein
LTEANESRLVRGIEHSIDARDLSEDLKHREDLQKATKTPDFMSGNDLRPAVCHRRQSQWEKARHRLGGSLFLSGFVASTASGFFAAAKIAMGMREAVRPARTHRQVSTVTFVKRCSGRAPQRGALLCTRGPDQRRLAFSLHDRQA